MKLQEIDKNKLYQLYIIENKSREDISIITGVSCNRIKYLLKINNITKGRSLHNSVISRSNKGKTRSIETKKNISNSLKGKTAWNKGLTKETDIRVNRYSNSNLGKKRTNTQRDLISKRTKEAMKSIEMSKIISESNRKRVYSKKDRDKKSEIARRLWENPEYAKKCSNSIYGNKSYYKGIRFMSDIEKKCAQKLDELGIKYETQPGPFKYLYSKDNKYHNYYPDFYLPKRGIYLEVKYLKSRSYKDTKVQDKLEGMAKLGLKCLLLDKKDLYNLDAVIG